jgi:hypothetical protein
MFKLVASRLNKPQRTPLGFFCTGYSPYSFNRDARYYAIARPRPMWALRDGYVRTCYELAEVGWIVRPNELLSVHQFTITDLNLSKFLM